MGPDEAEERVDGLGAVLTVHYVAQPSDRLDEQHRRRRQVGDGADRQVLASPDLLLQLRPLPLVPRLPEPPLQPRPPARPEPVHYDRGGDPADESAQYAAPEADASLPDGNDLHRIVLVEPAPVVDHVYEPRAQDTADYRPHRDGVYVVREHSPEPGPAANEEHRRRYRDEAEEAVPAEHKGPAGEHVGPDIYLDHLNSR